MHKPADGGTASVVRIRVTGNAEPKIPEFSEVTFPQGIRGLWWNMGDRSGISWSAAEVQVAGAAKQQPPRQDKESASSPYF